MLAYNLWLPFGDKVLFGRVLLGGITVIFSNSYVIALVTSFTACSSCPKLFKRLIIIAKHAQFWS